MHYGMWVLGIKELDHTVIVAWAAKLEGLEKEANDDIVALAAKLEERRQQRACYRNMRVLFDQVVTEVRRSAQSAPSAESGDDPPVRRTARHGEVKDQVIAMMRSEPHRGWRPKDVADRLAPMTSLGYVRGLMRTMVRAGDLTQDADRLYWIPDLSIVADHAVPHVREVAM